MKRRRPRVSRSGGNLAARRARATRHRGVSGERLTSLRLVLGLPERRPPKAHAHWSGSHDAKDPLARRGMALHGQLDRGPGPSPCPAPLLALVHQQAMGESPAARRGLRDDAARGRDLGVELLLHILRPDAPSRLDQADGGLLPGAGGRVSFDQCRRAAAAAGAAGGDGPGPHVPALPAIPSVDPADALSAEPPPGRPARRRHHRALQGDRSGPGGAFPIG